MTRVMHTPYYTHQPKSDARPRAGPVGSSTTRIVNTDTRIETGAIRHNPCIRVRIRVVLLHIAVRLT